MKVTVFGAGYVGLVQGAVLADAGHHVICVDLDSAKIRKLQQNIVPIYEPGLESLVKKNREQGRLEFTTDAKLGVEHAIIQFIAVGTPPDEDGSADLKYVLAVAESIAKHMDGYRCIVNKSTVPVGTADKVSAQVAAALNARQLVYPFDVVSNPEFLKEGAAVGDCQRPDRIVIGSDSSQAEQLLRELYAPFNRNHDKIIVMDTRSAELTKYAANCMLATKISFINEMANLAERLGADIEAVRKGIGSDPRIGHHFIYPGCGYGGSCFPKDVHALARTAQEIGYDAQLLQAVEALNNRQKATLFAKLSNCFGGESELKGRTFAVWGLAFKPNTDDMREAPSRPLIEALWQAGAKVKAFDPAAMPEATRIYGSPENLKLCADQYAALQDVDALVICTEWQQFRAPDFTVMAARMRSKIIVDGRNLYQPHKLQEEGWHYLSVGRPATSRVSLEEKVWHLSRPN
jgi:UDPglucose 6-dehydrogenase